eukprot:TRINITY_DN5034_c2_g1_i1.p1 TRINITY_DN5034_c2_g1~~TRINITY_DN5034_c2_g1_i1.p1  ORF type:complete len:344 (+),score=66.96 TRINITY_DN5034_c2_g1_i1:114-1145(+)
MNAALLQGARLKATAGPPKDRSQPVTQGSYDDSDSVNQFKDKIHAVNLENWYPDLKDVTFGTVFEDLSQEEARAIVQEYAARKKTNNTQTPLPSILTNLAKRIDDAMTPFKAEGAFVRLSTRSPKDAGLAQDETMRLFNAEVAALGPDGLTDENLRLIALFKASTQCLKVTTGEQALTLILSSERSNEDLLLALEFPKSWDMKVIIREWVTIDPSMEFRGFVRDKKFTALSQYFHIVYFANLTAEGVRDRLHQQMAECFEQIKDRVQVSNFIIDFAVVGSRVYVIELNPFNDYEGCGTDPCLFNWKTDREIVDGDKPFEFRIRETPFDVKPLVMVDWRAIIAV